MTKNGYQPTKGNIDTSTPPMQGSGVPKISTTLNIKYELTGKRTEYPVKEFGTGAHVVLPKRLIGSTVFVIEPEE